MSLRGKKVSVIIHEDDFYVAPKNNQIESQANKIQHKISRIETDYNFSIEQEDIKFYAVYKSGYRVSKHTIKDVVEYDTGLFVKIRDKLIEKIENDPDETFYIDRLGVNMDLSLEMFFIDRDWDDCLEIVEWSESEYNAFVEGINCMTFFDRIKEILDV